MDREQEEMQFLSFFGIYKESYKDIFSCWLPRGPATSNDPCRRIAPTCHDLQRGLAIWPLANIILPNTILLEDTSRHDRISRVLSKEWAVFLLIKALYFTALLEFSLLSTSAVVYTIACIYTGRKVAFGKVMSVVPRVWRRLMVTFLRFFPAMFVYNVIAGVILHTCAIFVGDLNFGILILILLGIAYLVGFMYMTAVWRLASVVSVLEEDYGVKAMIKSKNLIKGKLFVSTIIFFKLSTSLHLVQFAFERLVVWLVSMLMLLGLVVQTVTYFNINKSALSDHLEVYLGEYVPLKPKDVQLEQYDV
ncbi:hypothetical protein ACJRO7_026077 [Eucalyptus globulus]|uniref:Uncharacterized protein n=1 Tax=Eucalyptus globulus TaxID=34317 RepID=A0ABD3KN96_EUCGL